MQDRIHSPPQIVLTVGHSNRPLEEFLRLLQACGVTLIVDVRKMPGSRRNPQFGRDTFPQALQQAGIGYVHNSDSARLMLCSALPHYARILYLLF